MTISIDSFTATPNPFNNGDIVTFNGETSNSTLSDLEPFSPVSYAWGNGSFSYNLDKVTLTDIFTGSDYGIGIASDSVLIPEGLAGSYDFVLGTESSPPQTGYLILGDVNSELFHVQYNKHSSHIRISFLGQVIDDYTYTGTTYSITYNITSTELTYTITYAGNSYTRTIQGTVADTEVFLSWYTYSTSNTEYKNLVFSPITSYDLRQDTTIIDTVVTTGNSYTYPHTALASDDQTSWTLEANGVESDYIVLIVDDPVIDRPEHPKPDQDIDFKPSQVPGFGDIDFSETGLVLETGLDTTFFLAVYTDARASIDDNPDNGDMRGWWGDELIGLQTGSKAWLYSERGKNTLETIDNIRTEMILAVTRQMIDTNVVDDVEITYSRNTDGVTWYVKLYRFTNTNVFLEYQQLWDGQISKITKEVM